MMAVCAMNFLYLGVYVDLLLYICTSVHRWAVALCSEGADAGSYERHESFEYEKSAVP